MSLYYYALISNILAYNMPLISRNGIPMDMLPKLPIRGIKDSSTEPQRILEVLDTFAGDIFVGADSLISFAGNSGCTGVLVSLANVAPELCIDAFGGDISAQEKLKELERKSLERFPLNLKEMINERFHVPVYLGKP
jgi:4-hydroxy-tetrahydrodipicolinate synthase